MIEKKDVAPKIEILSTSFIDYSQIAINKTFANVSLALWLLNAGIIDLASLVRVLRVLGL